MAKGINFNLDTTKSEFQNPMVELRQGDGNYQSLHVTITSNGEPLDLTDWTITFMGTTNGLHKIVDSSSVVENAVQGTFNYTPTKAWGQDMGEYKKAYFKFTNGNQSASSANFRVTVFEAVDLTEEEAGDYISVVDQLIDDVKTSMDNKLSETKQKLADTQSQANTVQTNVDKLNTSVVVIGNRVDDYNNKLASIQVGGRNYILSSNRALSGSGDLKDDGWVNTSIPVKSFSNIKITISVQVDYDNVTSVSGGKSLGFEINANKINPDGTKVVKTFGSWKVASVGESFHGRIYSTFDLSNVNLEGFWKSQPNRWGEGLYILGVTGTNVSISNPKVEFGNVPTDWAQAPEDVPSNDAQLVHNTGTETVAGDKTFTGSNTFSQTINGNASTATLATSAKSTNVYIPSDTDANNLKSNGTYFFSGSNLPNSVNTFYVQVFLGSNGAVKQVAYRDYDNATYVRSFQNNAWNSWSQFAVSDLDNTFSGNDTFTGVTDIQNQKQYKASFTIGANTINLTRIGAMVYVNARVVEKINGENSYGTIPIGFTPANDAVINFIVSTYQGTCLFQGTGKNVWFPVDAPYGSNMSGSYLTNDALPSQ